MRNFLIYSKLRIVYVTSAGFEPATFGAEIRNSIQLNYEAMFWRNLFPPIEPQMY